MIKMPVRLYYTTKNGKKVGYYKWGNSGKKYFFTPGNKASRKKAREKAREQEKAIHASGWRGR